MMLSGSPKFVGRVRVASGLVPVVIVGVVMLVGVGGSEPAFVSPDDDVAELTLVAAGNVRMTEAQHAAFARAEEVALGEPAGSPFFYAEQELSGSLVASETGDRPELKFRVTSIMSGGTTLIAVVNGKARQVGDVISDGWSLAEINPKEELLRLSHEDGRVIELSLKRPRLGRRNP